MAIIIDLKNAIRDSINGIDNTINFNFNEIQVVEYPYIFFYITSYKLDKPVTEESWSKLTLLCVLEYAKTENNNNADLWEYADTLPKMVRNFPFKNTKLSARNDELKLVDGVLQLTFDLEFYVKEVDTTELMEELDLTLRYYQEYNIHYRRSGTFYSGTEPL